MHKMKWILVAGFVLWSGCGLHQQMREEREACMAGNENACQLYQIDVQRNAQASAALSQESLFLLTPPAQRAAIAAPGY